VDNRIASVLIMLDKTTIHSGCILFVPGSHKWGVLEHHSDEKTTNYKQWCVTKSALEERIQDDSVYVPVVGDPGDVFFFDCNILHGSGHNLSATSRKTLIYACADLNNRPNVVDNPRPDWVVAREFEPITVGAELKSA
jgi:ectoine hydroxylase